MLKTTSPSGRFYISKRGEFLGDKPEFLRKELVTFISFSSSSFTLIDRLLRVKHHTFLVLDQKFKKSDRLTKSIKRKEAILLNTPLKKCCQKEREFSLEQISSSLDP